MDSSRGIPRRTFLKQVALVTLGSGIAALGLDGCRKIPNSTPETYYTDRHDSFEKENRKQFNAIQPLLAQKWDEKTADEVFEATFRRFDELLPDLPYIGGSSNDLTANLVSSAAGLAFYWEMKSRGVEAQEVGQMLFQAITILFAADPMSGIMGKAANSDLSQAKMKKEAEESHKRLYPEDWVFEFVEGGEDFDYGIDYTECGICKYYQAQGAQEFTPYMCLLDVPISRAMGTGLVRTQTLARGGKCCDFRYRSGRDVKAEWDPGYVNGGK
jgi:hypothetical protein